MDHDPKAAKRRLFLRLVGTWVLLDFILRSCDVGLTTVADIILNIVVKSLSAICVFYSYSAALRSHPLHGHRWGPTGRPPASPWKVQ